jgi:hypothetical protein
MKTRAGLWGHDAPLIPTFGSHGPASAAGDAEEMAMLRLENARLQQLVAELLIANQQLRRRYSEATGAPDHHDGAPQPHRHDS